jgi:uncharacterized caspase-like protein
MGRHKTVLFALIIWLTVSLAGIAGGQNKSLKVQYTEALERAKGAEFDRAYEMAFKIIRSDEFFYDAHVLRIALAVILKKKGTEDPQNLKRVARCYAPIGSDLDRDVQRMVDQLAGGTTARSETEPSAPVKKEIAVSPYVRRKFALVVGIGSFKDTKINPLSYTTNDARAFADTLTKECKFDEVKLLIDGQATRQGLLTELDNISKAAQADDLVVIYIASHGSPQDLDTAGINYIVTYDSAVDSLFATSYKMKDLIEDIETRIQAQRVVAFIDTCFSGATFKQSPKGWTSSSRALKVEPSGVPLDSIKSQLKKSDRGVKIGPSTLNSGRIQQGIGRVIIASSRQNQRAWESDSIKHGYFTYYLIEALKQPKSVSIQSLYDYLSAEVPKAVQRDRKEEQNPTMVSSVDGPVSIFIKN